MEGSLNLKLVLKYVKVVKVVPLKKHFLTIRFVSEGYTSPTLTIRGHGCDPGSCCDAWSAAMVVAQRRMTTSEKAILSSPPPQ